MAEVRIILNPVSGMGNGEKQLPLIRQLFDSYGIDYDIFLTKGVWDAAAAAEAAAGEGCRVVVAAGGDGTCNEVINGLMAASLKGLRPPALGVLPVGRGNDFAYGAGLPSDISEAAAVIAEAKETPLDVGFVAGGDYPEGRYFGNGIGIGFDTMVGLEAAKLKFVHGPLGYAWGALVTFFKYPAPPSLRISYNGGTVNSESTQVSILNGSRMGGAFFMAPDGKVDDGLLDLCMMKYRISRFKLVKLLIQYTKGTQTSNPVIKTDRSVSFLVQAVSGGLICHADGETICIDGKELKVDCMVSALRILRRPEISS